MAAVGTVALIMLMSQQNPTVFTSKIISLASNSGGFGFGKTNWDFPNNCWVPISFASRISFGGSSREDGDGEEPIAPHTRGPLSLTPSPWHHRLRLLQTDFHKVEVLVPETESMSFLEEREQKHLGTV